MDRNHVHLGWIIINSILGIQNSEFEILGKTYQSQVYVIKFYLEFPSCFLIDILLLSSIYCLSFYWC